MNHPVITEEEEESIVKQIRDGRDQIASELSKTIVGQKDVVEQLLICLFSGAHCLITGAPGLAKTLLVRSVAQVFHLDFRRIQFTPDLMPADITGTEILSDVGGQRVLQFTQGPIFANVILADEINRTPPKTQAALLEAMQEHQVTAAGERYPLPEPFFVLATQNPIEMEGTYPLPEAQLDRFMFNVLIDYLPIDDELDVVLRTTSRASEPIRPLFTGQDVLRFHEMVRRVPVAEEVLAMQSAFPPPVVPTGPRLPISSISGLPGEPDCEPPKCWCSAAKLGHCCADIHMYRSKIYEPWFIR